MMFFNLSINEDVNLHNVYTNNTTNIEAKQIGSMPQKIKKLKENEARLYLYQLPFCFLYSFFHQTVYANGT